MLGFVLGVLCGAAVAGISVYALFVWMPNESDDSGPGQTSKVESPSPPAAATAQATPNSQSAAGQTAADSPGQTTVGETEWLGGLSDRIKGEIGSHSDRIEEISANLRAAKEGDPDTVLDAAGQMVLANQQLQAELAAARAEINEHRAKVKELAAEARTDVLTGLSNRRAFMEDLERRFEQWRRHDVPLSMIMLDIDHFKSVNDRFTHAGGDAALRHMGDLLRAALRQMDIPARYGGEEFAVILPGTKMADAINVAERLRATIAANGVWYEGQTIPITASLGLATALSEDNAESIIERADEALYAAKQGGRNRAYVHDGGAHMQIETDKALVRHPYRDLQQIAPYTVGRPLPTASDFYSVRCYDLSMKGISFITTAPPEYQAVVIRLGNPPAARYMIASVVNVATMEEDEATVYRVACTFVSRLDPEEILPGEGGEPQEAGELAAVLG